jgi:hypothetical protein
MRTEFGVEAPDVDKCWRIVVDRDNMFSKQRSCDKKYLEDLRKAQPFTDEKGYELYGPFPWGRWKELRGAIREFTRENQVDTNESQVLSGVQTFLYAGLGTPTGSLDASGKIMQQLNQLAAKTDVGITFELDFDSIGKETAGLPENQNAKQQKSAQELGQQKLAVMLMGQQLSITAAQEKMDIEQELENMIQRENQLREA